jgi:hypothetical protein
MPDLRVQVGTVQSVVMLGRELQAGGDGHGRQTVDRALCTCDGHEKRIKYQDKENKAKTLKRDKLRNMTEK